MNWTKLNRDKYRNRGRGPSSCVSGKGKSTGSRVDRKAASADIGKRLWKMNQSRTEIQISHTPSQRCIFIKARSHTAGFFFCWILVSLAFLFSFSFLSAWVYIPAYLSYLEFWVFPLFCLIFFPCFLNFFLLFKLAFIISTRMASLQTDRRFTEQREIPIRRIMITDPSQIPSHLSQTPNGTIYGTTPGGKCFWLFIPGILIVFGSGILGIIYMQLTSSAAGVSIEVVATLFPNLRS